ncbi:MAG: aminopeptidase P family protein [Clostridia bacterium]|nr:aminopeptidase P family protein [Clostridia bacterium]
MADYVKRREGILRYLEDRHLDGVLLTSYENRRYFSGFTGSLGYLLITREGASMVVDMRYTTQAQQQARGVEIIEYRSDRLGNVAGMVLGRGVKRLVLEACLTLDEYFPLKEKLEGVEITCEQEYFTEMRMVKDAEEISLIRAAIACAEEAFARTVDTMKIGMTEKDIADEFAYRASRAGADKLAFDTIAGSGPRGALAHAFPTGRIVENGDMVVCDLGVFKDGYCSDMTRTVLFGDVSREHRRIFDLVQASQDAAFAAVRPGVRAIDVENAHRVPFLREGLDDFALRGLGHGIGLEIHECPRVQIGNEKTVLAPGMIFTLEPGLYFPGDCGVRTEDDVLVTETGAEDLSRTPHEIHIG